MVVSFGVETGSPAHPASELEPLKNVTCPVGGTRLELEVSTAVSVTDWLLTARLGLTTNVVVLVAGPAAVADAVSNPKLIAADMATSLTSVAHRPSPLAPKQRMIACAARFPIRSPVTPRWKATAIRPGGLHVAVICAVELPGSGNGMASV